MKKFLSFLLVLTLILASIVTAMAATFVDNVVKIDKKAYDAFSEVKHSANNNTVDAGEIVLTSDAKAGWNIIAGEMKGTLDVAYKIGNEYFLRQVVIRTGGAYYLGDGSGKKGINHVKLGEFVPFYNVTYDPNGGEGTVPVDPNDYREGDEVTVLAPDDLTKEGYHFGGWGFAPDSDEPVESFLMPAKDVTLYAIWILDEEETEEPEYILEATIIKQKTGPLNDVTLTLKDADGNVLATASFVGGLHANQIGRWVTFEVGEYTIELLLENRGDNTTPYELNDSAWHFVE